MLELVREQTHVLSIASKIHSEVEGKLHHGQREFYLRQQLKAIRSELGEEVGLNEGFLVGLLSFVFLFCFVCTGRIVIFLFFWLYVLFSVWFTVNIVYYVVISSR